ncbi:replication termination factor 2-like isoform X2 [Watersipora subatra]|uniref:replication termination factor 2-like isoform X2 n=1 Tax=Watersipora subatra TaxID=2589382 RepID=UPI00355B0696
MGLDGGTIPTRGELVQVKKRPEQKDKAADTLHKWSNCTITQTPLHKPIVICQLGMLFNKSSILELLLGKSTASKCKEMKHIESLRDVKELQLTDNMSKGESDAPYICPITGLEMNGKHKFICLWRCGCVLSERGMKEVKSMQCHKCGIDYTSTDIVIINPTDEEFDLIKSRMEQRKSERTQCVGSKRTMDNEKFIPHEHSLGTTSSVSVTNKDISSGGTHEPEKKIRKKDSKHKRKKDKKDRRHRHKSKHVGQDSSTNPQIHPGWAAVLARR